MRIFWCTRRFLAFHPVRERRLLMKLFRIEGIPNPGAKVYSIIVARSPVMKDFYREVAEEVSSRIPLERKGTMSPVKSIRKCGL
jgi:hypothetical protein